jgi:hypothetical protein
MPSHLDSARLLARYRELQRYVGWTEDDARRVLACAPLIEPSIGSLIDDFYEEIQRHPEVSRVIVGGAAQIKRLKQTLRQWLVQLLGGPYDEEYVVRRWRVGLRHVEIGLDQVYVNAALSRLRSGILRVLREAWTADLRELAVTSGSLHRLLDLDLALMEDAYQFEHLRWRKLLEQRHLAEVRSRSEETFRNLVDAAGCLIAILRPDNTIAYFNDFAAELTGYAAQEVLGRDFFMLLVPAAERQAVIQSFEQALAGQVVHNRQNDFLKKDGSTATILWNARHLSGFETGPAVLIVGNDLTAIKEAERKALQSERLAAVGQMVAGLAHESRNVLQRCQACLEMLDMEVGDQPAAKDLIQRIQRAQDQLHRLFEEVRSYSGPIKLELSSVWLPELWREAWDSLGAQRAGRRAQLREMTQEMDLNCRADRFRLVQVFRNLLENSLAACKDPVEIEIACRPAHLGGREAVMVCVRDNGPGLTAEQRRRIFEPFFTTKTQGTGLGMAIAQRIVDAHTGKIAVGSAHPGAEIVLTLPRNL